jgi:hypothetical protein
VPWHTVCDAGSDVTTGALLMVSTAPLLVAVPHVFVSTQSYVPASAMPGDAMVYEMAVAPAIGDPSLRHWNVGAGLPLAPTVNVTETPGQRAALDGWLVTVGATHPAETVRIPVAETADCPSGLVIVTARAPGAAPAATETFTVTCVSLLRVMLLTVTPDPPTAPAMRLGYAASVSKNADPLTAAPVTTTSTLESPGATVEGAQPVGVTGGGATSLITRTAHEFVALQYS